MNDNHQSKYDAYGLTKNDMIEFMINIEVPPTSSMVTPLILMVSIQVNAAVVEAREMLTMLLVVDYTNSKFNEKLGKPIISLNHCYYEGISKESLIKSAREEIKLNEEQKGYTTSHHVRMFRS
ncbi:hypothetical protein U3516DRAFT_838558 [Neocallimastix sp. 'constans']